MLYGLRRSLRGKKFGNEIADSMGLSRGLLHTALEEGGFAMHLIALASMKDEGVSVVEARELCLPFLSNGLDRLEQRFGPQQKISSARGVIEAFSE